MTLLPLKDPITRYYHTGEQGFNICILEKCKHPIQSNNLHFYLFPPSPLYLCSIPVNLAQLMFFVSVPLLVMSPHFYLNMSKVYYQTCYKLITSLFVFYDGLRSQAEIKCSPLLLVKLLEERSFKDVLLHDRKQTITQDQPSSVQFSRSVVSDSLRPHEPQHTRPPCPSPTPGVCPNHVPRVDDVIKPSDPLLSPSPPALNFSQHQGLFQ